MLLERMTGPVVWVSDCESFFALSRESVPESAPLSVWASVQWSVMALALKWVWSLFSLCTSMPTSSYPLDGVYDIDLGVDTVHVFAICLCSW
jgi:hypothetical protein